MAIYDAVFWEKENTEQLFIFLKSYHLSVIRIKPSLIETLKNFFETNTCGVIFTDKPEELRSINTEAFIVGLLRNKDNHYADLTINKEILSNGEIPQELASRILRFINKARILAESRYKKDKEIEEDIGIFDLSRRERELYNVLCTYDRGLSSRQICAILGWNANMLRVYVTRLKKKGYQVEQISGKYILKKLSQNSL